MPGSKIPKLRKETDQNKRITNFKPKLYEEHATSSNNDWYPLFLKTNAFTEEEVAIFPPTKFSVWSIGEEESTRRVVALDWTPLPVAKHQRYALGVLTSNHILAIWASNSTPTEAESWKRVLIVNHALDSYFKSGDLDDDTYRLRRRIRSFSWSPRFDLTLDVLKSRTQYLAVANECNEVIVFTIQSPYTILNPEINSWQASVLFHFSIAFSVTNGPTDYSSQLNHYIEEQRHATHMSWSHWFSMKRESYSILAIITRGRLVLKRIKLTGLAVDTQLVFDGDVQGLDLSLDLTGPIRWVPDSLSWSGSPENGISPKQLMLCAFSENAICHLAINPLDARDSSTSVRHLDGRWDEVSGTSFITNPPFGDKIESPLILPQGCRSPKVHEEMSCYTSRLYPLRFRQSPRISLCPSMLARVLRLYRGSATLFNNKHFLAPTTNLMGMQSSEIGV